MIRFSFFNSSLIRVPPKKRSNKKTELFSSDLKLVKSLIKIFLIIINKEKKEITAENNIDERDMFTYDTTTGNINNRIVLI